MYVESTLLKSKAIFYVANVSVMFKSLLLCTRVGHVFFIVHAGQTPENNFWCLLVYFKGYLSWARLNLSPISFSY